MQKLRDMKQDIAWMNRPGRKAAKQHELDLAHKSAIAGKTHQLQKLQKVNKELATIEKLDTDLKAAKIKNRQLKHPTLTKLVKGLKKVKLKKTSAVKPKPINPYAFKPGNDLFTSGGGYNPIFHGTGKK